MAPSKQPSYSQEDLQNAISAIENGMSYYRAAILYKIPKTTLIYKKLGKIPMERKMGPDTFLSTSEETLLVKWMFQISDKGFPPTKECLLDSVQLLIKELKRVTPFVDGRPGRRWYESFLRRHPQVGRRVSQNLSNARAKVTESKICNWFKEVREYFETNELSDILGHPDRIFNCDETAIYLSPKDNRVLVRKGQKAVYSFTNNDDKECITTLFMCCANGTFAPPMVLHNYKRMPQKVALSMPESWGLGSTDSGWMTGESFYEYVVNVFWPWLQENAVTLPIALFLDGHVSHMSMALSEFCSSHNIILIALLPNATHILQPLDVSFFRPFKVHWKKMVYQWKLANNGNKLFREDFAPLLKKTLSTMSNKEQIIVNGFRTCGLFPFSEKNIDFNKFFKQSSSNNCNVENDGEVREKYRNCLKLVEREIPIKLLEFERSQSQEIWEGDTEDKSLFNLWRNIKIKAGLLPEVSENDTFPIVDTATENLISEVLQDNPNLSNLELNQYDMIIDINENDFNEINENNFTASSPNKTPGKNPIVITIPSANVTPQKNSITSTSTQIDPLARSPEEKDDGGKIKVLQNIALNEGLIKKKLWQRWIQVFWKKHQII